MEDIKAIRGSILPSAEMPTKLDFESRQAFETRKSKRMNQGKPLRPESQRE
jgi:hypothetical protein